MGTRKAFTLIEVNLAVVIMAVGVLGLISLYSLGYRESSQSREDVEAAVLADRNLNALVTMLSSTNVAWSSWKAIGGNDGVLPSGGSPGWLAYIDSVERRDGDDTSGGGNPNSIAEGVFADVASRCGSAAASYSLYSGHMKCGLVVYRDGARIGISFRAARRAGSMIYQPLYYTEVHFQGDPTK